VCVCVCECVTCWEKCACVCLFLFLFSFLESQGEEGLVVRWASMWTGGRVDSLVFTLALIFVRILTLFFYRSPEMWVQESLEEVGGGVIEREFLWYCKTLLKKTIDFNDYSHIYPCKILFLCYSFFFFFFILVNYPNMSNPSLCI